MGKSTLINSLCGEQILATAEIRDDGRGRHTTTRRELVPIPSGGVVLDTPGLRELALWSEDGVASAFDDVEALAQECRFRDCNHRSEPGCAVRRSIDEGTLDSARFENYRKMQREVARLTVRKDQRAFLNSKRKWKSIAKAQRQRARFEGR